MKHCNLILWADGIPAAVCTQEYGTTHSHDYSASDAIARGLARPITDDDVLYAVEYDEPEGE